MPETRDRLSSMLRPLPKVTDDPTFNFRSKIDAAQTTDENKRHWAQADAFSADAAYDVQTRFRLRNRSRYETVNNCYAKAAVRSSADDLIGTGPRMQLYLPPNTDGTDSGDNARCIRKSVAAWMDATNLPIRLRMMEKSEVRDGECFGIFDTNPLQNHPVKLFVRWVEAEMCTTPFLMANNPYLVDGILFDRLMEPVEYYFLAYHPGNLLIGVTNPLKFYSVPAKYVVHWYSPDRFGQHRGIPQLTPSLPLYSQVRRYTLATLTAAEFAAMLAGIMKTNTSAEAGNGATVDNWELFELVRGALLTLPQGWDAAQFRSEQPTTTYPEFKREVLNESGRATNQPLNVITGNSSGYNFSSGRLDHLPYHRGLRIKRNDLRLTVLDPIVRAWYIEALQVGEIPDNTAPIEDWSWCWNWDGFDSIDPQKDAATDDVRLKNGTATYHEIFADYGQDAFEQFQIMAQEKAELEKLGLPWPVLSSPPSAGQSAAPMDGNAAQAAVLFAMSEAGIPESQAANIMHELEPTFAELRNRLPSRNGKH